MENMIGTPVVNVLMAFFSSSGVRAASERVRIAAISSRCRARRRGDPYRRRFHARYS